MSTSKYIVFLAAIVSLGGFLFGYDASVISGALGSIRAMFPMSPLQEGFVVSSPTLAATFAMLVVGPISDALGRKKILITLAFAYAVSAIFSALAPNVTVLILARMLGGLAFGAALIMAPMYIAEIAPARNRGKLVSINQLNIVLGFSASYFANYLINEYMGGNPDIWRWMLGFEAIPALVYFVMMFFVPESPRWLVAKGRVDDATKVISNVRDESEVAAEINEIQENIEASKHERKARFQELFSPSLRLVLSIGLVVGILQQITGINIVFFYANTIFEQSGIGSDASFVQAVWVGLINVVFTLFAIYLIDKIGRKPLLIIGLSGIVISMFISSYGFHQATFTLTADNMASLPADVDQTKLEGIVGTTFQNDVDFKNALIDKLGKKAAAAHEAELIKSAVTMNPFLILVGILGFVASFAISLGPVMWVLFSELFPNWIRGVAISFVGFINSATSFLVQFVFPWEMANLGTAMTFAIYGILGLVGLVFIIWLVPETKGKSLEQLERQLVSSK